MHGGDVYRNKVNMDYSVNINPCRIPAAVPEAMHKAVGEIGAYPDPECSELKKGLAGRYGVDPDRIICGSGASELIMAVFHAVRPAKVLLTAPGFSGYERAANAAGAEIIYQRLYAKEGFAEHGRIANKVRESGPELLCLCNPNNPSGSTISKEAMRRIAEACALAGTVLLVDECFAGLTDCQEEISSLDILKDFPRMILLRAFTKSFAVPGLRLGYGICGSSELAEEISLQLPEWNVSLIAQEAGAAALKEEAFVRESAAILDREREYLAKVLEESGAEVFPSRANYILFYLEEEAGERSLYEKMLDQGILIRDCSDYKGLGRGYYRIAVKTHDENLIFAETLHRIMDGDNEEGGEENKTAVYAAGQDRKEPKTEYVLPGDIEKRSFEIIGRELESRGIIIPAGQEAVTKRVIHTSADFDYAATMCYSENAIETARELIRAGADIVTDTNMAKAGINKKRLALFGGEVHCFMADEDVAAEAKRRGLTRAYVSMERASKLEKPVIFAIGNAPTALLSLKALMEESGYRPAFIIGVPVGFVNVEASKELIMQTGVPFIVNRGRKGGSNVAAAICNAILYTTEK